VIGNHELEYEEEVLPADSRALAPPLELPPLPLEQWRATKDTLHLYVQIVGKVRLATTPLRNHWWNVPLYVDVRGLTTRRLHHGETEFEIALDFIDDALVVQTGDGRIESFSLADGLPVAGFDACLHDALRNLGVDVAIQEKPFGVPMKTPFREDTEHGSWDHEAVARFARILDWSDSVLEEFSGWFNGKTSPVHFFWHGFDLAVTRFSGRPSRNSSADPVSREAYSHEVISFGFWPGDDNVPDAAYYSYTAPEPEGLREQPLAVGSWMPTGTGHHWQSSLMTRCGLLTIPSDAARLLRERLRGRRARRRLGHHRIHLERMPLT
jgi:Family of unknown function (DUF5996)